MEFLLKKEKSMFAKYILLISYAYLFEDNLIFRIKLYHLIELQRKT